MRQFLSRDFLYSKGDSYDALASEILKSLACKICKLFFELNLCLSSSSISVSEKRASQPPLRSLPKASHIISRLLKQPHFPFYLENRAHRGSSWLLLEGSCLSAALFFRGRYRWSKGWLCRWQQALAEPAETRAETVCLRGCTSRVCFPRDFRRACTTTGPAG